PTPRPPLRAFPTRRSSDLYPSGDQRTLQRTLHARHIPIIFSARPHAHAGAPPVHHRLRYITTAVLAAALAIGTALFFVDARRRRDRKSTRLTPVTSLSRMP